MTINVFVLQTIFQFNLYDENENPPGVSNAKFLNGILNNDDDTGVNK